jgi:putative heme-binding domain-containing protein
VPRRQQGGGDIGPDLSAVGATSPVEHLVNSVLNPDQAIKEAFETKIVLTEQGRIYQGIVADRTSDALVLKDANGKLTSIPISDIDEEIEGKSLMPKGLVKFMTHAELIDLVRFLSMLGKPGEYAVRSTQRMQRWRVMAGTSESLLNEVPNRLLFEDAVLGGTNWEPAYSRVNGELPLPELAERTGQSVLYVYGEVQVSRGGPVEFRFDSTAGLHLWVGTEDVSLPASQEQSGSDASPLVIELEPGVHRVTLRADLTARPSDVLKLELFRPSGARTEFAVVDGP